MRIVIAAAALAVALASSASYAESVTIHGSTTVTANLLTPKKADIEQASGIQMDIVANGSGRGLADLLEGKAQLAMISAPLADEVRNLKAKGVSVDETKIEAHQVGEAPAAFAVHPSNPVKTLTAAQMTDILSGKIKNWKEVGGVDKPIIVICESKGGGVRSQVEHDLLNGGDVTAEKRELPNATQIAQVVGQLDSALGLVSKVTLTPQESEISIGRKIVQPLILVTLGAPTPAASKLIAAAKQAGGV